MYLPSICNQVPEQAIAHTPTWQETRFEAKYERILDRTKVHHRRTRKRFVAARRNFQRRKRQSSRNSPSIEFWHRTQVTLSIISIAEQDSMPANTMTTQYANVSALQTNISAILQFINVLPPNAGEAQPSSLHQLYGSLALSSTALPFTIRIPIIS